MIDKKIKLKYLIVGFGNIGHKRKTALGTSCLATVDPNSNSGADYTDFRKVPFKIINKCNAVNIVVPNDQKLPIVEHWLSRGKNVLVEKPLILTNQIARKLQKTAKKNSCIWYTSYNNRFEPNIQRIKQLLDKKAIGQLYMARFVFGFGNVQQLIGTWRESANGVFDEVGCHLIDFAQYLFGYKPTDFEPLSFRKTEAKVWDHCLFSTRDRKVLMEASWIMWKNNFSIEIYGEKGSVHMTGLCKWGTSELLLRERVYPAGIPVETKFIEQGPPDPTWALDIRHFEEMAETGQTSCENDLQISKAFENVLEQLEK